jgi:hypothetical protein
MTCHRQFSGTTHARQKLQSHLAIRLNVIGSRRVHMRSPQPQKRAAQTHHSTLSSLLDNFWVSPNPIHSVMGFGNSL